MKNKINSAAFILVLIIFAAHLVSGQTTTETPSAEKERIEAERAWEQLIEMKGGREKLHSITNMLTEISSMTLLDIYPE